MIEEKRIYVVVAGTVQVPTAAGSRARRTVEQPTGRQIAQACHAVSKLRIDDYRRKININTLIGSDFESVTTIVLQARDSAEIAHTHVLLHKKKLDPNIFFDTNDGAYGTGVSVATALAVFATKKQIENILDYLPLWGS